MIKWNFYFMVCALFLISVSGQAQVNHTFKIGLSKIFNGQYFLAYEGKVFQSFSINAEIGLLRKAYYQETIDKQRPIGEIRTNQTKNSESIRLRTKADAGYQFNIEGRWRPGASLQEGLYLGLKSGIQLVDFGSLEVGYYNSAIFDSPTHTKLIEVRQIAWMIGGTLGASFKIHRRLFLDINIFSGYSYIELVDPPMLEFVPYTEPAINLFRNNHINPIDQLRLELNVFLGF